MYLTTLLLPLLILYNAVFRPLLVHPERSFFFGFILVVTFLLRPLQSEDRMRRRIYLIIDLVLIASSIVCAWHIMSDWRFLVEHFGETLRPIDVVLGIVATVVTLEACRRAMWQLVPVCLAFILYAVFGQYIAGTLQAPPISWERLLIQLYVSADGLYGLALNVCLKFVIPFLIMGCLLKEMGAMDVLGDFVNKLVGRTVGGPAKLAVVTSGLFGTMSGSAVANVAFTGTFTIPLMKKYGFKPEFAGGVEAAASTGGMLMPPIMGTAAFLMADYTAIPYLQICLAAVLSAVLYYLAIFIRVHYQAKQQGLQRPSSEIVGRILSWRKLIPRLIPLVMAFAVLLSGLFMWTPTRAAVVTAVAIVLLSFLRRKTRLTPKRILTALSTATYSFVPIGAAFIAMGILFSVAFTSGLGLKFSELMLLASGQSYALLLIVTAVACLIMGMGIGGVAVYVFAAVMIAPAMLKLGVPLLASHLFIFYYSNIQSITPPVCLASYTAASIANAKPTLTALQGVSIGLVGFVIPFAFVLNPELLLQGDIVSIVAIFLAMACGLVGFTFALGGYMNRPLSIWERALFFLGGALIYAQTIHSLYVVGAVIVAAMVLVSVIRGRRSQTLPKEV